MRPSSDLLSQVQQHLDNDKPNADDITSSFWGACHGGQLETASLLLERDADINWIGYDNQTPLDAAQRSQADAVATWLPQHGAKPAAESSQRFGSCSRWSTTLS
jgi:ankyrin repeat protein